MPADMDWFVFCELVDMGGGGFKEGLLSGSYTQEIKCQPKPKSKTPVP